MGLYSYSAPAGEAEYEQGQNRAEGHVRLQVQLSAPSASSSRLSVSSLSPCMSVEVAAVAAVAACLSRASLASLIAVGIQRPHFCTFGRSTSALSP